MVAVVCTSFSCASTGEGGMNTEVLNKLNKLESDQVTVYYSNGSEELGKLQFERICNITKYYKEQLNVEPHLAVYVLNEKDWDAAGIPLAYGMPFIDGFTNPHQIVGPATPKGVIVDAVMKYKDVVPQDITDRLASVGMTYKEAAERYPNMIVYHESGHGFQFALGFDKVSRWFGEFLASYFLVHFVWENDPKTAIVFKTMSEATYLDGSKPKYTTLKELEELYMDGVGMQNYDWYQKQINLKIYKVHEKYGLDFIKKCIGAFPDRELNSKETIAILEKLFPGEFADWANDVTKIN